MGRPAAQYDKIGTKYNEYARTATLKRAERYSVTRLVGDLNGKQVLDLACGFGFYTRLWKQRGAARVVGVDISLEMIRLAREQGEPLGVTYRVADGLDLPHLGEFDLITAIYLLDYAETKLQLAAMLNGIYANLAPGGKVVAYTINPDFTLEKPNNTKYGVTVVDMKPEADRYVCSGQFVTEPPTPFRYVQWNRPSYDRAMRESGFREVAWHPTVVAPQDVERFGPGYWQDLLENCLVIGLVGKRPL